jgi:hypothetical protein
MDLIDGFRLDLASQMDENPGNHFALCLRPDSNPDMPNHCMIMIKEPGTFIIPGRIVEIFSRGFEPDLLTFAIFRFFQAQESSFQDTNGLEGGGLKFNAWHSSV